MRTAQCLTALAIVYLSIAPVRAEEPTLPTPPQQAAPWTPPETRLPRFLATAAQALFDQGLADPRGCEYRSIRVRVGDERGGQSEVATAGWALPAGGGKPGHAVAWNGLVYPLVDVGEPADLDADVRSADERRDDPRFRRFGRGGREDEAGSIAIGSSRPIRVCLLLRLGRADLAEELWTRSGRALAPKPTGSGSNLDLRNYGVSYLTLATDFAQLRYNRAIAAHMRADDALALADARALDAFLRAVDAQAAEMGFTPNSPQPGREPGSRYIRGLNQAAQLLVDQERRARERANPPPPPPEGDKVAALIRALDQITTTRQAVFFNGNFGGPFDDSPTIKALIDLGDAAVEPLIRDLRADDRLTRSLDLGGGPFREYGIMRADRAAYLTLSKILKVSSFGPPPKPNTIEAPADPNEVADQIQAYWDKYKGVSPAERWYRTLADDRAGVGAWLEAAVNIVRPEGGAAAPGAKPRLQGEPLRDGHAPSVAELMIRRVESIRRTTESPDFASGQSMQLLDCLAAWDPAAAAPALRDLTRAFRERYAGVKAGDESNARSLVMAIVRLTTLRVRVGDESALADYAEWLKTTSIDSVEPVFRSVLEPLRAHLEDPSPSAAVDWLFSDPRSPWAVLTTEKGSKPAQRLGRLIASPAIEIPAFRKLVQKALADGTIIGKAEITDDGVTRIRFDGNSTMGRLSAKDLNDPDAPPIGAKADVRARDFLAWQLAARDDAPQYNPCWPEAKRAAALAEFVDYLNRERP